MISHAAEKYALERVLEELFALGWLPFELWSGEEWGRVDPWQPLELTVDECAATDAATLRMRHYEGKTGAIGLVWSNNPIELIAANTTGMDFDKAMDAAIRKVWPDYPEEEP